ncbi:hypothetical protein PanWU01x14_095730, partial [Parasponia andersonii]
MESEAVTEANKLLQNCPPTAIGKSTSDFHDLDSNKGTRAMTSFIDKGLVFYWATTETSDSALDLMASTKSS